ncbi:MAG: hypothetical protein ACOCQD_04505 [archaeon]
MRIEDFHNFDSYDMKDSVDFSKPLDVCLFSNYKMFKNAINIIISDVKYDIGSSFNRYKKKYIKFIKIVILNVFEAWKRHEYLYISYSRDSSRYQPGTRYSKLFISYKPLIRVIDSLIKIGYIKNVLGYYDRVTGESRQSRMRATDKLINKFLYYKLNINMVERNNNDLIILRDHDKNDIEYKITQFIKSKKCNVRKINRFIAKHKLTFNASPSIVRKMYRKSIQFPNTNMFGLTRIYNESFEQGGRFYRGWWQGLPSEFRQYIQINGNKVTELDYASIHPYLLYAKKGLAMPANDMYSIDGMSKKERRIAKVILLTIFNINKDQDPIKPILYEMNWNKGIELNKDEALHILNKLKDKHKPISEFFASGVGGNLQRIDSDIAENIMLRLMEQNIVSLPIHDSFIVQKEYSSNLHQAMIEEAQNITGQLPRIDKKY